MNVRRLVEEDAETYVELRKEMLVDSPFSFLASPEDDRGSDVEETRRRLGAGSDAAIFGAFDDGLVGAAGIFRAAHLKAPHKDRLIPCLDQTIGLAGEGSV